MSGADLIALEGQGQISKHGYDAYSNSLNNSGQLLKAAISAITIFLLDYPKDWTRTLFEKLKKKSKIERLIIAGALIAAEIDRLQALEE